MLKGELDTDKWDEMMARLMRGMTNEGIGNVLAIVLKARIQDSYDERWEKALPEGTKGLYDRLKGLLGLPVGTLTGSSKRAISVRFGERESGVYLKGSWPNEPISDREESFSTMPGEEEGVARVMRGLASKKRAPSENESDGRLLRWDDSGVELGHPVTLEPLGFIPSEPFSSKVYGADRGGPEIDWFTLIPGDEDAVEKAAFGMLQFLIDMPGDLPPSLSEAFS